MDFSLTKVQQDIVDKARWVAKEFLEPRAAGYDASASHPRESWKSLWDHGLLAIAVPRDHGGQGLDMPTYVMVIENLAYGCTNSSMTLHMHSVVQRYIDALATPEQKARFYPDVVEKGKLLTLTTQEALTPKLAAAKSKDLEQLLETYKLELVAESRKEAARAAEAVDARGWFEQFRTWHVWLLLGLALVVVEILIPAFFVLWFGVGALVAALLAFLGMSQAVQVSAFLAISFLLLVFSRTIFQSTLFRSQQSVATNVEALKGQQAIVLKAIEGTLKTGSVKIGGEVGSAICEEETQILEGAKVEVLDVVGNKVRVKPI